MVFGWPHGRMTSRLELVSEELHEATLVVVGLLGRNGFTSHVVEGALKVCLHCLHRVVLRQEVDHADAIVEPGVGRTLEDQAPVVRAMAINLAA